MASLQASDTHELSVALVALVALVASAAAALAAPAEAVPTLTVMACLQGTRRALYTRGPQSLNAPPKKKRV